MTSQTGAPDAHAIARLCADAMWSDDRASQGLGMRLEHVGPGTATLSMTITDAMVNGLGICHGGFVFTLADSACAFASNSRNQRMVLSGASIALIAPATLGMKLVAEASERQRNERTGLYDITVRTETGTTIAEFRGQVRSIPGKLVETS